MIKRRQVYYNADLDQYALVFKLDEERVKPVSGLGLGGDLENAYSKRKVAHLAYVDRETALSSDLRKAVLRNAHRLAPKRDMTWKNGIVPAGWVRVRWDSDGTARPL